MKVKKVVFTDSELNAGTPVLKEATLQVSSTGQSPTTTRVETITKYPISMSVVNDTGVDVEIALIGNEDEEVQFNTMPEDFFIKLPDGASIGSSSKIGRAYKVSCRVLSTPSAQPLRVDFYNHVGLYGTVTES